MDGRSPCGNSLSDTAVDSPSLNAVTKRRDVGGHACKRGKEGSEFRDLKRLCVGCKDDVLVVHLHLLRKEVTGRIDEAH